jgi:hypothetical protein
VGLGDEPVEGAPLAGADPAVLVLVAAALSAGLAVPRGVVLLLLDDELEVLAAARVDSLPFRSARTSASTLVAPWCGASLCACGPSVQVCFVFGSQVGRGMGGPGPG